MGIMSTRKDIGGGQATLGQARAVGATTHRLVVGYDAGIGTGRPQFVHNFGAITQPIAHIAIRRTNSAPHTAGGVASLQRFAAELQGSPFGGQLFVIVIANNKAHRGSGRVAFDIGGVNKTAPAGGAFGGGKFAGQHAQQFAGEVHGVDHAVIVGSAGVGRDASDFDDGAISRKSLPAYFTNGTTIKRISGRGAEMRDIEMIDAMAYFFVWVKTNPDLAVRDAGIAQQLLGSRHDNGNTGFVIGTEERRARGGDDIFAQRRQNIGVHRVAGVDDLTGIVRQYNHAAVVVGVDDGLDAVAAEVGGGIDVRQKSDHGSLFVARGGGDGGEHIAMGSNFDITSPNTS